MHTCVCVRYSGVISRGEWNIVLVHPWHGTVWIPVVMLARTHSPFCLWSCWCVLVLTRFLFLPLAVPLPACGPVAAQDGEYRFTLVPLMVCANIKKTVGLGDTVSATGLTYSFE